MRRSRSVYSPARRNESTTAAGSTTGPARDDVTATTSTHGTLAAEHVEILRARRAGAVDEGAAHLLGLARPRNAQVGHAVVGVPDQTGSRLDLRQLGDAGCFAGLAAGGTTGPGISVRQRAEVKARTLGGVALTSTACLDCPITLRADPTPGADPFGNDRSPSGRRF